MKFFCGSSSLRFGDFFFLFSFFFFLFFLFFSFFFFFVCVCVCLCLCVLREQVIIIFAVRDDRNVCLEFVPAVIHVHSVFMIKARSSL